MNNGQFGTGCGRRARGFWLLLGSLLINCGNAEVGGTTSSDRPPTACEGGTQSAPGGGCPVPATCAELNCEAEGRPCIASAGPIAAVCGACKDGSDVPMGSCFGNEACAAGSTRDSSTKTCRPLKTCTDLACVEPQVCTPASATEDASCGSAKCSAGRGWDPVGATCRACDQNFAPRCDAEGETGAVLVLDTKDGAACECETKPGYYIGAQGGAAVPCDADEDGWVSDSAQPSLEGKNPTVRANSRCDVRRVGSVVLQNEGAESVVAADFNNEFGDEGLGIPPGLPLYESARNDGAPSMAGSFTYGDADLDPRTVNSLTKYCGAGDYNDNGVSDVAEWSDSAIALGTSRPSKALLAYYAKYAKLSYFAELHNGWYEAGIDKTPASYRIAERLRAGAIDQAIAIGYPAAVTAGVAPAEVTQCVRHIDAQYKWTASFGGAVKLESNNTVGGDYASFGDVSWGGMTHHSQFKCIQLEDEGKYKEAAFDNEAFPEILFARSTKLYRHDTKEVDEQLPWFLNDCKLGDAVMDSPGSDPRTAFNTFACSTPTVLPDAGTVTWAAVGFENTNQTTPYASLTDPGTYKRGCRNECAEVPEATAGLASCDRCVPDGFGKASTMKGPANAGSSCGSCGGTVQCDGRCSFPAPASYGQSCGSCGGTVQCDGRCSVATPVDYGQSCGSCGGTVQCDASCSVGTPADLGANCGSCSGKVQCDSSCSVATPADYGASCGCGGTVQCGGSCSRPAPGDFGTVKSYDTSYSFGGDLFHHVIGTASIGRDCDAGWHFDHVDRLTKSGNGNCNAAEEGAGCKLTVNYEASGTDGATCIFRVYERRGCD